MDFGIKHALQNLDAWMLERLKGVKFQRAKMLENAVDEKMRMLVIVDAGKMLIVTGVWVGFRQGDGHGHT